MAREVLEVEARLKDYITQNLKPIQDGLAKTAEKAREAQAESEKASGGLMKVALGFVSIAAILGTARKAWTVLMGTIRESIGEYKKQVDAEAMLRGALGYTSKALIEYSGAMQKASTFADDEVLAAEAAVGAFIREESQIKKLIPVIMDMAAAKGMTLVNAAELVTKSIASSTNSLTRYGIQIEGAAGSTERLNMAVKNISAAWGGMSSTMAKTDVGQLKNMELQISDVKEEIGKGVLPAVAGWRSIQLAMLKELIPLITRVSEIFKAHSSELEFLGKTFMYVFKNIVSGFTNLANFASAIADWIRLPFDTLTTGILSAVEVGGKAINWLSNKLGKGDVFDLSALEASADAAAERMEKTFSNLRAAVTGGSFAGGGGAPTGGGGGGAPRETMPGGGGKTKEVETMPAGFLTLEQAKNGVMVATDMKAQMEAVELTYHAEEVERAKDAAEKVKTVEVEKAAQTAEALKTLRDARIAGISDANARELEQIRAKYADELLVVGENLAARAALETAMKAELNTAIEAQEAEHQEKMRQEALNTYEQISGAANNLLGTISGYLSQQRAQEYAAAKSTIESSKMSEKEKEAALKRAEKANKEAAKKEKAIAIIMAIVNTAMAVTKSLAGSSPPVNFIMAALSAAAGAVQIATIASQNFARGGIVRGNSYAGDNVPINVNSGEAVLTRQQQQDLFDTINTGGTNNAGSTVNQGSRSNTVNITLNGGATRADADMLVGALMEAQRDGKLGDFALALRG